MYAFPKGISTMWNRTASSMIWTRVAISISYDDNITQLSNLLSLASLLHKATNTANPKRIKLPLQ